MSRYSKSDQVSSYWQQNTLAEKKNARLVGRNTVQKPVVASLGQAIKEFHRPISQRSLKGDANPEHN